MTRHVVWVVLIAACGADRKDGGWTLSDRTQVILLGTGSPNADPARSGPATAVVVDGVPYIVDCGPGVVRRAAAAGLKASSLGHVFITHLHTDHTLGLPDLIFTCWVLERGQPLQVYGPPGTKRMTDHILAAYDEDIRIRLDGFEPANTEGYKVVVHEMKPGVVLKDERVTVTAFRVDHGSWKEAFGFRFETPDRTIVISGDTRPSENLIEQAKGVDLLIHEVYSHEKFQKRMPVWQRYHSLFHTSTLELGEIAKKTKPRLLVLTHQLLWGATDEDLLREISTVYDGPVVSGADLDRF